MLKTLVSLAVMALSSGVALAADPVPYDLIGQWRVELLGFTTKTPTPPAIIEIKPDNTFSGYSGCNRYSGAFQLDKDKITFAAPAATRMKCAPAAMEQEAQFFNMLNGALTWKTDGRTILVSRDNQPVLKLSPPTQEADVTIRVPGAEGVNRQTVRYACGDKTVDVEYINAGPVAIARLTIGDDFVVAANVLSGSGAKYAGGRYIWWAKGDEATLFDLYRGDDADGVTCRPAP